MSANREQGGSQAAWTVVLGPGARLGGIEGLARACSASLHAGLAVDLRRLQDLAQLIDPTAERGRLVLDGDQLPMEDLGFVRRFLAARPGWDLLIVGEDAGHRAARAALALPRTRWLPWPPDLAQLEDMVRAPAEILPHRPAASAGGAGASPTQAPAPLRDVAGPLAQIARLAEHILQTDRPEPGSETSSEATSDLARLARLARSLSYTVAPPQPGTTRVDLGALLEDQLAALTLRGKKAPRFLYRGARGVEVRAEREALATAMESLLLLARGCSGPGEMVRVELTAPSAGPGDARVLVDFPAGPLAGSEPLTVLMPGGVGDRFPDLGALDLPASRAVLEGLDGRLVLGLGAEGGARLTVTLPAEVAPVPEEEEPAAEAASVGGGAPTAG